MTRLQAKRIAAAEIERARLLRAFGIGVIRQVSQWQADMLAQWERTGSMDVRHQLDQLSENIQQIHRDAAVKAMLTGFVRVAKFTGDRKVLGRVRERQERLSEMRLPEATIFGSALEFFQRTLALTPAAAAAIAARFDVVAIQASVQLTGVAVRSVDRAFRTVLAEGLSVRQGQKVVRRALRSAGLDRKAPWAIERTIRTTNALAYEAGRETGRRDPAIRSLITSLTYVTLGDDRVRPSHEALDGTTLPVGHSFWAVNTPPNGYNCRCTIIENFEQVAQTDVPPQFLAQSSERDEKLGQKRITALDDPLAERTFRTGADDGWRFNPGDLFGGLSAA